MNGFLTLSALTANAFAILALHPPHTLPMLLSDSFFSFTPLLQVGFTHTISSHLCFSHSHSDLIRFSSVQNYLVMRVENETETEKGSRIEGDR